MISQTIRDMGVRVSMIFDKKSAENINSSISKITSGLKTLAVGFTGTSAALLGFAEISSGHSRTLQQNSQQLGVNVEKLQELQFAAKVAAGVTEDELQGSLEGISKTLFDARNNVGEAGQTFVRLGLTLDQLKKKNVNSIEVMETIAETFKNMPDGIYKTSLANEAFGASGAKLIPLLNKGKEGIAKMGLEARGLGVVMNKAAVDQGAAFDRQLSKIWITLKNLTYVLGSELIKYLAPIIRQFEIFLMANRKFIVSGIVEFVKSFAMYFKIALELLQNGNKHFKEWIAALGGAQKVFDGINKFLTVITGVTVLKALASIAAGLAGLLAVLTFLAAPFIALGFQIFVFYEIIKTGIDIFNSITNAIKNFWNTITTVGGPTKLLGEALDSLKAKAAPLQDVFAGIHGWIDKGSSAITEFSDSVAKSSLGEKAKSLFGELPGKAEDMFVNLKNKVTPGVEQAQSLTGPQALTPANTTVNHGDTTMNATINVTVPRGTDAASASDIVSGGVQKGFHAILRQTRDQFLGGVAQ